MYKTMNHKRISEAKCGVNLRFVLLLVFCTELHAAVPFFPIYTNVEDVYAVNKLYSALGSPPLSGWTSLGGDPCFELWQGIRCTNNNITSIALSGANLRGKLQDDSLANFTSLSLLDLSNNSIGGTIPKNLPSTLQIFSLSGNQFTGSIPSTLSQLKSLTELALCENQLSGTLPDVFQPLRQLAILKLSDNKLSGHLPLSMKYLTSLTTMHVQNNDLSGTLDILQNLPLKDLNIANNQFSGPVPENLLKIPNFKSDGNQLIITINPSPETPPAAEKPPAAEGPVQQDSPSPPVYNPPLYHKRKTVDAKAIAFPLAIGSSIIIAIAILLFTICIPSWKAKRNVSLKRVEAIMHEKTKQTDPVNNTTQWVGNNQAGREVREQKVDITDFQSMSVSIEQSNSNEHQQTQRRMSNISSVRSFSVAILQQYTNSFSEDNLIEECSFGKIYLAEDEERTLYTVLKIEQRKSKIPFNNFLRLVEYVSKMQHPNIVELVGYCAEYEQRLLVYRYFSKQTLNDVIHSMRTIPLSWMSRIQVALEAAKALEYLHGSNDPIVHQQFASCNILLDDKLQVRVSCCGLASSLSFISEFQESPSPLAVSYNAPEINESANWSIKSDVYSFGVVLLELLTGREPYDSSRPRSERYLARWASYQLHDINTLVKMVDPVLGRRFPIKALSRVADIISCCIQEEPEFRPTMSEVVQDLTRALDADDTLSGIS